jgi:hypothetical protein
MKKSFVLLMVFVACFALAVPAASAKRKSKNPNRMDYQATLVSSSLPSPWQVELVIDRVSTDEELQEFAQTYTTGGQRALEKAMDKLDKGYVDLGGNLGFRMRILVVQLRAEGVRRRIGILTERPPFSPLSQLLGGPPEYPHVCIGLEVDEHGNGKGNLIPQTRVTFNAQGQMVLQSRSPEHFELTLVHALK